MRTRALLAVAVVLTLSIGACATSSDANAPAARTAALFVTLDTLGDRGAADTLLNNCDDAPTDSVVIPITGVIVDSPTRSTVGDTVIIVVHYATLGAAHPEDAGTAGPLYWRFTSNPREERVPLHIAPDADGRLWIACGDFRPNHPMLTELVQAVKLMDEESRADLELAKAGKPSAKPAPAEPVAAPVLPAAAAPLPANSTAVDQAPAATPGAAPTSAAPAPAAGTPAAPKPPPGASR